MALPLGLKIDSSPLYTFVSMVCSKKVGLQHVGVGMGVGGGVVSSGRLKTLGSARVGMGVGGGVTLPDATGVLLGGL